MQLPEFFLKILNLQQFYHWFVLHFNWKLAKDKVSCYRDFSWQNPGNPALSLCPKYQSFSSPLSPPGQSSHKKFLIIQWRERDSQLLCVVGRPPKKFSRHQVALLTTKLRIMAPPYYLAKVWKSLEIRVGGQSSFSHISGPISGTFLVQYLLHKMNNILDEALSLSSAISTQHQTYSWVSNKPNISNNKQLKRIISLL